MSGDHTDQHHRGACLFDVPGHREEDLVHLLSRCDVQAEEVA